MTEAADRESPRGLRLVPFLAGLGLGLAAYLLAGSLPSAQRSTAAITATTTSWWIGGAMPLGAASLFPFVALPLAGAMPVGAVAAAYFDPIIEQQVNYNRLAASILHDLGQAIDHRGR